MSSVFITKKSQNSQSFVPAYDLYDHVLRVDPTVREDLPEKELNRKQVRKKLGIRTKIKLE